jgi:hypothetical protein
VQQAFAAQASAHGTAPSAPPPAPLSTDTVPGAPTADDQETGFFSLHQVTVQAHTDPETGDTWHSHWLEEERRYCRGRALLRPSRGAVDREPWVVLLCNRTNALKMSHRC